MEVFENLSEEKRQRILNAALGEFAAKGFEDASTNRIVQEAGISKGALFHYFGNKKKLFDYLMVFSASQVKEQLLVDFPDSHDLIEVFSIYAQRKSELARVHPLLFDFWYKVFQEQQEHPLYKAIVLESVALMKELFHDRIDTSKFRDGIDLAKAIDICTWMSEGFARKYAQEHQSLDVEKMMKVSEELFTTLKIMIYRETSYEESSDF